MKGDSSRGEQINMFFFLQGNNKSTQMQDSVILLALLDNIT